MSRRRLAAVLRIPEPVTTEIDGIRLALGDSQLGRIVPHVTMVPPTNVAEDDLVEALTVLRVAASAHRPLDVTIGPTGSFAPANDALYLRVAPVEPIAALRADLLSGVLERREQREFIPHVTIAMSLDQTMHAPAARLLEGYERAVTIDHVDLMELDQREGERAQWVPIADAELRSPEVVAAGAFDLSLTRSTLLDPVDARAFGVSGDDVLGRGAGDGVVVVGRDRNGTPLGLAAGRRRGRRAAVLRTVFVVESARGNGVARRLVEAWERSAADGGSVRIVAPGVASDVDGLLAHLGWSVTDPIRERRIVDDR